MRSTACRARMFLVLTLIATSGSCERVDRAPAPRRTAIKVLPVTSDPKPIAGAGPVDDTDGCTDQLQGTTPSDIYAALTRGSVLDQQLAALAVLKARNLSPAVIQRAIYD